MITRRWLITFTYFFLFWLLYVLMKLLSLAANNWPDGGLKFFLFSPVPSFRTWNKRSISNHGITPRSTGIILGELIFLVIYYQLPNFTVLRDFSWVWQGYVAIIPFIVLVDLLGRCVRFLYWICGIGIPHINKNFFGAQDLIDFWSCWNVWFSDFLEETCFRPFLRRPMIGVLVAFTGSGFLHEYLVNLPLYWVYEVKLYGTMLLYFLLQGIGILVQRRWLDDFFMTKRILTWLLILLPAPLVLNLGTLRIFHLGFLA